MTEDGPLGIMLYGYDMDESKRIQSMICRTLETDILLCSASGKEETVIGDILENPSDTFESREPRVLMFLGFDDDQICRTIDDFPKDGSIPRPIFCGLTAENINWPMKQLIEHLLEEDRYWKSKKKQGSPPEE